MILEMTRPVQGGLRQERKLEAVANNLANADTTGFKKDTISFDERYKAQINKDFSQGTLQTTGNPLDFAGKPLFLRFQGKGFLRLRHRKVLNIPGMVILPWIATASWWTRMVTPYWGRAEPLQLISITLNRACLLTRMVKLFFQEKSLIRSIS